MEVGDPGRRLMRLALIATIPPLALLLSGWAACWMVEPAMLRDRFGRWFPPAMATMLAVGELTGWLVH